MKKIILSLSIICFLALAFQVSYVFDASGSQTNNQQMISYKELSSLEDRLTFTAFNLDKSWSDPTKPPEESNEKRRARLRTITKAVILELPFAIGGRGEKWFWTNEDLAWLTFNKIYYESSYFSLGVHSGKTRGDRGKSVCLGQIMYGGEDLVGTDLKHTRNCIKKVMQYLIMHQHGCLNKTSKPGPYEAARIYAGYGTGRTCDASHFIISKDADGNPILDDNGEPVKIYWAQNRGAKFWRVRNGLDKSQKTTMLKEQFYR